MEAPSLYSRREALRLGLLFSAALMTPSWLGAEVASPVGADVLDLFCFGDWGVRADENQKAVAQALRKYAAHIGRTPQSLLLLGDNFYGKLEGVDSSRWQNEFEDMYPATAFPGPCYAILGNHDYDDQPGGEKIQLAYAKKAGTRWRMPALWYRVDFPAQNPVATFWFTNTHFPKLSQDEIAAQNQWLVDELARPATAPWRLVCGHHPVMSCGTTHGGTPYLFPWKEFFKQHHVDAYVCGHEHDLQHLREPGGGTDWLVAGGGGRSLHDFEKNAETQFAQKKFGFLHLALTRGNLIATFVGADASPLYRFEKKKS
jgi:hypothetical protein